MTFIYVCKHTVKPDYPNKIIFTEMKIHCCEGNINLLREECIHLIFTSSRHKFYDIISVYLVF